MKVKINELAQLLRVVRCLPTNECSARRGGACWASVGQASREETAGYIS
jgi:hypothetical protein